ncbi:MAG: hypothetical protein AB8F34_14460 [Akkermansiaceae bacterium]
MENIREMVQPLYDAGDLVGFSICGDAGEIIHNESFFSDEVAWQATAPFVRVMRQMEKAERIVNRLTVELDDVTLIYGKLDEGNALFTLNAGCDLDRVAGVLT